LTVKFVNSKTQVVNKFNDTKAQAIAKFEELKSESNAAVEGQMKTLREGFEKVKSKVSGTTDEAAEVVVEASAS
jgi:soluble cytochrome b562